MIFFYQFQQSRIASNMYFVSKQKYRKEKQILVCLYCATFSTVAFICNFLLHNYFYIYVIYKLEITVD
jgi:hypothetical protein